MPEQNMGAHFLTPLRHIYSTQSEPEARMQGVEFDSTPPLKIVYLCCGAEPAA